MNTRGRKPGTAARAPFIARFLPVLTVVLVVLTAFLLIVKPIQSRARSADPPPASSGAPQSIMPQGGVDGLLSGLERGLSATIPQDPSGTRAAHSIATQPTQPLTVPSTFTATQPIPAVSADPADEAGASAGPTMATDAVASNPAMTPSATTTGLTEVTEPAGSQTSSAPTTTAANGTSSTTQKPKPTIGAQSSAVGANGWAWPYPDSRKITSSYGSRTHPITGKKSFHYGTDIWAAYGGTVAAARSGRVSQVVYPRPNRNTGGTGFGNYIRIDHGNGLVTLYAHLKTIEVKVGQNVRAGQRIAGAGSTGASTGPHLHFAVYINGSTVNPMRYYR